MRRGRTRLQLLSAIVLLLVAPAWPLAASGETQSGGATGGAPVTLSVASPVTTSGNASAAASAKTMRWRESEYGGMLERILPLSVSPEQLPQSRSTGARLVSRYCVQCHNLPNPAMHAKEKWPGIVDRMVVRMRGIGNMGTLMKDLMAGVEAPNEAQSVAIVAYLQSNSQRAIDASRYADLADPAAQSFRLACSQCHALPDPRRHRADEWPQVVKRMERNMEWMNRIVGNRPDPREPQLRVDEILAFLQKHSR